MLNVKCFVYLKNSKILKILKMVFFFRLGFFLIFFKVFLIDFYYIFIDMIFIVIYFGITCYISVKDRGEVEVIFKGIFVRFFG